ncbi:helix-turn-helix domain-containing protein [bacterium]|nr:helix-turn-helix domain-containing protein [bacterium]
MSHIGKNIKKIRTVKKLSQQAFAELFGLSRANIGSYEEGRAEPKIAVIVDIANKFGLEVDSLLNKELRVNEITRFKGDLLATEGDDAQLNPDLRASSIPFVSVAQQTTYLNNLSSQLYLQYMPKFEIPNFEYSKARAFEVDGNQLLHENQGVFARDILICIYKDAKKISELTEGKVCALVTADQIVLRRLYFGKGSFVLKASNRFYDDMELLPDEVEELWEAHTIISSRGGCLH